jgi:hypothetical protein
MLSARKWARSAGTLADEVSSAGVFCVSPAHIRRAAAKEI